MSICHAVLMCHAPIVIPAIGGSRGTECAATTAAMAKAAESIVASGPDVLLIVSPHAPRHPTGWGVARGERLAGDFARFGRPDVTVALRGAAQAGQRLAGAAERAGLSTWAPPAETLLAIDHGAAVPLYFVQQAGYAGPTLLVSLPYPGTDTEERFGEAIAQAAGGQRWAVLASGDMSHRLIEGAPSGFHPRARQFDAAFVDALRGGDLRAACSPHPELQQLAAEDVIDSTRVATAAIGSTPRGLSVLHYEGPFGVGYCEAILHDGRAAADDAGRAATDDLSVLLPIARDAIDAMTRGERYRPPPLPAGLEQSRGVFVTLRDGSGGLRGCIGHMQAAHSRLADEVADCARAAARSDPRFAPVTAQELPTLSLEISLLTPTEVVDDVATLDPRRYGVVVSHGDRRGVLLPDIDGVDTVEQQLRIAGSKGGLPVGEPWEIERFEVQKVSER